MAPAVPLLRLPNAAIKNVLKTSDVRELIIFSTLSARAKRLVMSANRKADSIHFNPEYGVTMYVPWSASFVEFGDKGPNDPCTLVITQRGPIEIESEITKPEFGVREWLEHVMSIFNHPELGVQFGERQDWIYTLETVRKLLEGMKIDSLDILDDTYEVLEHFPVVNTLFLGSNESFSREDFKITRKVLLGNIGHVQLHRSRLLNLDTLLMMNNCEEIRASGDLISDKDLNTFLKLWLNGSHRNLTEMYYTNQSRNQRRGFKERIVFKGMKYEKKECFDTDLLGVYEIIRWADGTRVTVLLADNIFRMVVHPSS